MKDILVREQSQVVLQEIDIVDLLIASELPFQMLYMVESVTWMIRPAEEKMWSDQREEEDLRRVCPRTFPEIWDCCPVQLV